MVITEIEGLENLRAKIALYARLFYTDDARRLYLKAARKVRDAAKRAAPIGRHPRFTNRKTGVTWEPGKLRRAIIAYASRRTDLGPAAFTRVNIYRGRERAPHAHLVAFGTRPRTPKSGRLMVFLSKSGDRWTWARRTAPMRANPFFQRALAEAGPGALDDALSDTLALVLRTATA